MKLEPLPCRSESPVQGMSDRQQESRGFNPVRKSMDIRSAPEVVMRAIERSKRGHELFGRVREAPELVVYELKTLI